MAMAQSDSQLDIRSLVSELEKRIALCPRREVVAQFDEKHHKQVWQKQGWGPPTDVFGDAKTNDDRSVLYPYVVVIEFSLKHTFGPERQTRADAAKDSELSDAEGVPAWLLTGRYRNTYLAVKMELVSRKPNSLTRNLTVQPASGKRELRGLMLAGIRLSSNNNFLVRRTPLALSHPQS